MAVGKFGFFKMGSPCVVDVVATYEESADQVFEGALRFSEMTEAMSGLAVYKGLPDEAVQEGATYVVDVTFWKLFTVKGHIMHIELLDRAGRILQSREHAPGIRRWDHTLSVQPRDGRTEWRDTVLIDAGWRTPFMARFATYLYRRRHKHRQALSITSDLRHV